METSGFIKSKISEVQLIECPRDAMQGWHKNISTKLKVEYLNTLLQVGFDTIDFGSFVSPKAIPQMADTGQVINQLKVQDTNTRLLAIVANVRGAKESLEHEAIGFLGFPFSLSPTFQMRNTNSTMEESLIILEEIQNLCIQKKRQLVIYLSMGFGNPYGDEYNEDILITWTSEILKRNISIISLADTIGVAAPSQISLALETMIPQYPHINFGVHLHSKPDNWKPKLEAAIHAGCKRFDGALKGIGGCPMAQDDLVGNMNTEHIIQLLEEQGNALNLNKEALEKSMYLADQIFSS